MDPQIAKIDATLAAVGHEAAAVLASVVEAPAATPEAPAQAAAAGDLALTHAIQGGVTDAYGKFRGAQVGPTLSVAYRMSPERLAPEVADLVSLSPAFRFSQQ